MIDLTTKIKRLRDANPELSWADTAAKLNEQGIKTATGKKWIHSNLYNFMAKPGRKTKPAKRAKPQTFVQGTMTVASAPEPVNVSGIVDLLKTYKSLNSTQRALALDLIQAGI